MIPQSNQVKRLVAAIILVAAILVGVGLAAIWGSWQQRDQAVSNQQNAVSSASQLSSVGQQVIDIAAEQQRVVQELARLCDYQPVPKDLEPACQKASVLATQSIPTAPQITSPIPTLTVVTVTSVHPETVPFTVVVVGSTTVTTTPAATVVTSTLKEEGVTVTAVTVSTPDPVTSVIPVTTTAIVPSTQLVTITQDGTVTTSTVMTTETAVSTQTVPTTETMPVPTTETNTVSVTITQTPDTLTITETPSTTSTSLTTVTVAETDTTTETTTVTETVTSPNIDPDSPSLYPRRMIMSLTLANMILEFIAIVLLIPMTRLVYTLRGKHETFLIFFPIVLWLALTAFGIGTVLRFTSRGHTTAQTFVVAGVLLAFIGIESWVIIKIYSDRRAALKASRSEWSKRPNRLTIHSSLLPQQRTAEVMSISKRPLVPNAPVARSRDIKLLDKGEALA